MSGGQLLSRRRLLAGPMLLPMVAGTSSAKGITPGSSEILVAYMTRTGNTRVIAGQIQRSRGATLFEIRSAVPYPEDYEQTVEQARKEREAGYEPPLEATVPGMAGFHTVYLGFPVWGGSLPPPIRTFLTAHDWRGKEIRPFITHGGYGTGDSLKLVRQLAAGASVRGAFTLESDQERRTLARVSQWLDAA